MDAGNYNQTAIRKVSRKLKIQNETVLRYDKFLHPQLTQVAIERATKLILDLAGGEYYQNIDWYPKEFPLKQMTLRYDRLRLLSGSNFDRNTAKKILTSLEYKILEETNNFLKLEVPYFRTDVEVEDDLVADILRINGYSKISSTPINTVPSKEITPKIYKFEDNLKDILLSLGLHEHITDPLVCRLPTQSSQNAGNRKTENQVVLENSLNPEKAALRTSIYQTLKTVVETYSKHKADEIGVFEIGKTYKVCGVNDYIETRELEVIYISKNFSICENADQVKHLASSLFQNLGIDPIEYTHVGNTSKIYYRDEELGEIRHDSFSLYTEKLLEVGTTPKRAISELVNFRTEDISFIMDINKPFGEIYKAIEKFDKSIKKVEVIEVHAGKGLENNKKAVLVRLTFDSNNPLEIKQKLITVLKEKFNIEIR